MKMLSVKSVIAIVLILIVILSTTACSSGNNGTESGRWEYSVIPMWVSGRDDAEKAVGKLNELGAEGWELVSDSTNSSNHIFVLKRKLP